MSNTLIINQISVIMSQNAVDPEKVKKWIKFAIAVLSALLGAIVENSTNFIGNIL